MKFKSDSEFMTVNFDLMELQAIKLETHIGFSALNQENLIQCRKLRKLLILTTNQTVDHSSQYSAYNRRDPKRP